MVFLPDMRMFAKLWKNGISQNLIDSEHGAAYSVFVSSGDVYVAGYRWNNIWDTRGVQIATLWKNGKPQNLSDETNSGVANSVFVSGSDVYVAGMYNGCPILWKNGKVQNLELSCRDIGLANSVYVSGNDVYVTGFEDGIAKLWKNGKVQNLTDGTKAAGGLSVFVK